MKNTRIEKRISIRFPMDVLDTLRQLARIHERSFNGEVIWALRDYAKRQTKADQEQ